MDWNLAIERNRAALKRIVATLAAMAELDVSASTSLLSGLRGRSSDRDSGSILGREGEGDREAIGVPGNMSDHRVGAVAAPQPPPDAEPVLGLAEGKTWGCRPPLKGEVKPVPTLPRHLHRAILRLIRPAESAVRRLIIVMARGLEVTLPPPRPRKAKPAPTILRNGVGTGIVLPRGAHVSGFPSPLRGLRDRSSDRASGSIVGREGRGDCEAIGVPGKIREASGPAARTLSLPLFDPLRRSLRSRRSAANGVPRISLPGVTQPSPIALRHPPAPDDLLNATRLALRLAALGAALDDLPAQARRFARWQARKEAHRDAAGAQNKNRDAAGAQNKNRDAAGAQSRKQGARRVWPLRPGRPPGQRPANLRTHEVYEILHDLHGLAFDLLERRDTS
jgi:hypothetical protein